MPKPPPFPSRFPLESPHATQECNDIKRVVITGLRRYAQDAPIHCEHLAVTPKHIETMDLPLRPIKPSDSRAKGLKGDCVEFECVFRRKVITESGPK